MKLIHTSDWQIGKPFGRAPDHARGVLQDARLDAIDTIGALAAAEGARAVLVAGDVFDSSAPSDRELGAALSRMGRRRDVRWLLLPGNHDPVRGEGLWARVERLAPPNVVALVACEPFDLGDDVWVLPAPLLHKRASGDATAWFDEADTPAGARRLGLAHGSVADFSGGRTAAAVIPPDRAERARLDYLALGDWHGHREIGPRTRYSGTPEPDDFDHTGHVVVVELRGDREPPRTTLRSVGRHAWRRCAWEVGSAADLDGAIDRLREEEAGDLSRLVLRATVAGVVTLGERLAVVERLRDRLAHEVRWLDLDVDDLLTRPTDDDLGAIDAGGVLRVAAERLLGLSEAGGVEGRRALAALERLHLEQVRASRAVEADA